MLFYTIFINHNYKLLAGIRKLAIAWDKLKGLVLKEGPKVFQKEKKEENELLVCTYF